MKPRLYLVEQSALEVGGHYYAYTRTVAAGAVAIGLNVIILQNRRFGGEWEVEGVGVIPAFQHTWGEANQNWLREWKPGQIAYDFHHAIMRKPPREGDHVLFSTLGNAELQALLDYFLGLPVGREYPTYHILLRYDPEEIRDNWEHYEDLFRRVSKSALLQRVLRFHTDTHLLSEAYGRLTGIPFTTLPIPFAQEGLKRRLAEGRKPTEPFVVTYLGDARLEKNFADIPDAVSYLLKDYVHTRRVRFVLQSNFNIEGGEPGMLQAVQRLGQTPSSMVQLIDKPLNTKEYYDILADSDIVLVPYNAQRYQLRSSGILIEAMAAGKPVITTRGSWMETQVSPEHSVLFSLGSELGAAIKKAIDDFDRLTQGAKSLAPTVMDYSGGKNFVRALLTSSQTINPISRSAPHVLYIIDGGTLVLRNGAAVIVRGHLSYLLSAKYRVSIIVIMRRSQISSEELDAWILTIQDRLSAFDIEALFVTGFGRFSSDMWGQRQRRGTNGHSILEEVESVGNFDVNLDLINHLNNHRPHLIFMNYVVNMPLIEKLGLVDLPIICETHDVQAFQKAIYGHRRIDFDDILTEMDLLSKCKHLISVSPSETKYIREFLPNTEMTTIGVFPEIKALGVRNLAGAKNLAEVLSSCGNLPSENKSITPPSQAGESLDIRFKRSDSIDLFYISSNHLANVSGLRWFLNSVYLPYLAPMGVTFVIAGSICDWGGWPESENLFIVGRLDKLEPIYAAARIVVAPIIEGAGAAVKVVEALTYGRPIVATSIAIRGLDPIPGGVVIADTPQAMFLSIQQLLSSEALRCEKGAEARRAALQLADPKLRGSLLDKIFVEMLGERALPTPVALDLPTDDDFGAWTPTIEHVNRLVRNWLENEPLEDASLMILSREPPEEVGAVLRGVVKALFIDRDAPGLMTEKRIMKAVAGRHRQDADIVVSVILTALEAAAPAKRASASCNEAKLVFDRRHAVTVQALNLGSKISWRPTGGIAIILEPKASAGLLTAPILKHETSRSILAAATLHSDDNLQAALISQTILFDADMMAGVPLMEGRAVASHKAPYKSNHTYRIELPIIYSSFCSIKVIDIFICGDPSLKVDVEYDGAILAPQRLQSGAMQVLRVHIADISLKPVEFSLTFHSRLGTPSKFVQHIVLGEGVEHVLTKLDRLDAISPAKLLDGDVQGFEHDLEIVQELKEVAEQQRSLARLRALSLRQVLGPDLDEGVARLIKRSSAVKFSEACPTKFADVLDVRRLLSMMPARAFEARLIASQGLTMKVDAKFASEADAALAKCLVDGFEAGRIHIEGERAIWRVDGRTPTMTDTWMRCIHFTDAEGKSLQPASVSVVFNFVAAQDRSTGKAFVDLSNSYEPLIFHADLGLVWTGPKGKSRFSVPLSIISPGKLVISLANIGDNWGCDDIVVGLNGARLQIAIEYQGEGALISADFPPDPEHLFTSELTLTAARLSKPPSESRQLGVAINWIELCFPLVIKSAE